jgi:secreted trypsin-like serine protease
MATSRLVNTRSALTDGFNLQTTANPGHGQGGTCSGDSGGPVFYNDPVLGRVQVSLVSGGDAPCRATNTGPGFSRAEALAFVACGKVTGGVSAVRACVDSVLAG